MVVVSVFYNSKCFFAFFHVYPEKIQNKQVIGANEIELAMEQPTTSVKDSSIVDERRRKVQAVIVSTCLEAGYQTIDMDVLDHLTRMYIAFVTELSLATQETCEHAGRTEPLAVDVLHALLDLNQDISTLPSFAYRRCPIMVAPAAFKPKPIVPKILQTSGEKPKPASLAYLDASLPPLPDAHTYMATPTMKNPEQDYQSLRIRSSTQKHSVEIGLTKFMARTDRSNLTYSLFSNPKIFSLIGIKHNRAPYLKALLPVDAEEDDRAGQPKESKENGDNGNADVQNGFSQADRVLTSQLTSVEDL